MRTMRTDAAGADGVVPSAGVVPADGVVEGANPARAVADELLAGVAEERRGQARQWAAICDLAVLYDPRAVSGSARPAPARPGR